jgi:S1-C subfamily serine protease
MTRRAFLRRLRRAILALAILAAAAPWPGIAAAGQCPQCGAPLEPGAAFCVRCGHRVAVAPAEAGRPERGQAVVQVVTVHDKEITSTFGSLAFESNLRIDSILGSAFAVAPRTFVTDSGLLAGAREISLRTAAGRSVPARIVGADPMIGVALLEADLPEVAVSALRGEPPRVGEPLRALGFSISARAGGEPVVSAGVVSGLNRGSAGIHPIEDYLQTDASLPPGLAGGPMIDSEGRVVGMSTGLVLGSRVYLGPQSGIGYAIPAEWIERALGWIRSGAPGRVWIGAHAVPADAESRKRFGLPPQARLLIDQVFPGSPADAAGLARGDGLLRFQGEEVSTLPRLQLRLLAATPGEPVALQVARVGEVRSISLTPSPRPDRPRLAGIDALRFFGGLELEPRGDDRLVVASVAPGSAPARLKLAPGDVLQSVLSKKDWEHGAKDNSRWRSVRSVADLEARLATAYSDLDFCLGLRFRARDGTKREIFLWEILTPAASL